MGTQPPSPAAESGQAQITLPPGVALDRAMFSELHGTFRLPAATAVFPIQPMARSLDEVAGPQEAELRPR